MLRLLQDPRPRRSLGFQARRKAQAWPRIKRSCKKWDWFGLSDPVWASSSSWENIGQNLAASLNTTARCVSPKDPCLVPNLHWLGDAPSVQQNSWEVLCLHRAGKKRSNRNRMLCLNSARKRLVKSEAVQKWSGDRCLLSSFFSGHTSPQNWLIRAHRLAICSSLPLLLVAGRDRLEGEAAVACAAAQLKPKSDSTGLTGTTKAETRKEPSHECIQLIQLIRCRYSISMQIASACNLAS